MTVAVSASKIERLLNCPTSFRLPQVEEGETEQAARGTSIHAFLERYVKAYRETKDVDQARDEALSTVPAEHAAACESIDLVWLHRDYGLGEDEVTMLVEAGFGWNPDLGFVDYYGEHCQHGKIPSTQRVTGIADLVLLHKVHGALVIDYKTGRSVTRAQENPQLKTLAAMVAGVFGGGEDGEVAGAVVYVRDGEPWFDHAKWDVLDLDGFSADVSTLLMRIEGPADTTQAISLKAGKWCRYCPAFSACPAQMGTLRAAAEGYLGSAIGQAITKGDIVAAYRALKELRMLSQHLEGQLRNYVEAKGPLDLGDGMEWGPRPSEREHLKGDVVYRYLAEAYGQPVALAAVKFDATKKKLKEALRPVAKEHKTPLAQVERAVLGNIRANGGVEVNQSVTFDEHPKKET